MSSLSKQRNLAFTMNHIGMFNLWHTGCELSLVLCRPFRCLNSDSMTPTWTKVTELAQGKVYLQGNVKDLMQMMKWEGKGVLYFGDHVFSDLAVSWLLHNVTTHLSLTLSLDRTLFCSKGGRLVLSFLS